MAKKTTSQKQELINKEKAEALLEEAEGISEEDGIPLVKKALEIYPNLVEGHTYLADFSETPAQALPHYKRAMEAGKAEIGPEKFEELKGHFWGFHETRPFMQAKADYASLLRMMKKYEESITQYKELLELNPNDNQGLRHDYSTLLIQNNKYLAYEALRKQYGEENNTFWLFNHAIYSFKKHGKSIKANHALATAYTANAYVLKLLVGEAEFPAEMSSSYALGTVEEAAIYLSENSILFKGDDKMKEWILRFLKENI